MNRVHSFDCDCHRCRPYAARARLIVFQLALVTLAFTLLAHFAGSLTR